jgi:hypothetical protein
MSISSLETIIKLDRKYVILQAWKQQVLNACTIANPELATSIRQSNDLLTIISVLYFVL